MDKKNAVFNPHDKPINELPFIYGFNNGGSPGWYMGQLITQDGYGIGNHLCSAEGYMPHDLGIFEGSRPDRHKSFQKYYPDGYRMEFIPTSQLGEHKGINAAFKASKSLDPEDK